MPLPALPPRHKMQQMNALRRLAILLALVARQLDLETREDRQTRVAVPHPHQPGVEVDLGRERRYREETGPVDRHERRNGLVKETLVHVRRLLQDDDVATRPLGRPYLSYWWLVNNNNLRQNTATLDETQYRSTP